MKKRYEYETNTNFIALYKYHCGTSQVPDSFHKWSSISLLAACMGNNIWLEKFKGDRLYPNLYVLLIGPSAVGKGIAIGKAHKFADYEPGIINPHRISTTKRGNIQLMSRPSRFKAQEYHGSRIYTISPELVNDIGSGPLADEWVRWMTAMFTETDTKCTDSTGVHGIQLLDEPMINWLGGSTEEWMRKSITEDAITGGFFARTVVVSEEANYSRRIHKPTVPWDYDAVKEHLIRRIQGFCRVEGQMVLSPEAEQIDAIWFHNRPPPDEEWESAMWNREHDIILKVAMVVAMSDLSCWGHDRYNLTINGLHIQAAQQWVTKVHSDVKPLIKIHATTRESMFFDIVVKFIKGSRDGINHTTLLRKVYGRGVTTKYLANIIATLMEAGHVDLDFRGDRKAKYYVWKRKRLG